jgi:hypothetical protein
MATIATTEFRSTDIYQYVPFTALQAGIVLASSQTTGHIKVACFQEPVRVLELVVANGSGVVVAGTTFRAAVGPQTTAVTADLTTTLGAASLPVASSNNSLAIDTATTYGSVDTGIPPVVPAGTAIGINIVTPASSTVSVIGAYIRYRPA